jgi:hypothetical protein
MVQITATIAPVTAATRNAKRMGITFYNASTGGETISLGKNGAAGLAAGNREYVLNPSTGLSFLIAFDGPDIQGEWGAYGSADTAILVVGETAERGGV